MAKDCSFDIVSQVDLQELDNAVNQAAKELSQRFDFRNSQSSLKVEGEEVRIISDDEFKLENVLDIFRNKAIKRNISPKFFDYGKVEPAARGTVRQTVKIKNGVDRDNGRKIVALIKDSKLKVQTQMQDDQIRVTGKNKDDLQQVIAMLKKADLPLDLQFTNFRS